MRSLEIFQNVRMYIALFLYYLKLVGKNGQFQIKIFFSGKGNSLSVASLPA